MQLSYEICLFKENKGIYLSNSDKEILNKLVSADKTESYRTNSFYKRIIGLYTWDILRENRKTNFTDIRNRIVSEKLYKYNKKIDRAVIRLLSVGCTFTDCLGICFESV